MNETTTFEILLLFIGIASTALIAYLFKYVWKPKPEKVFEDNLEKTTQIIFQQLSLVDSFKKQIIDHLDNDKTFDMEKQQWHTFSEDIFEDMLRLKKLIKNQIDFFNILKFSGNITLNQYSAVQMYALSAYSFFHIIENMQLTISVDKTALKFHMYHAKQIIQLFGDLTPRDFRDKWNSEFTQRSGGIDSVTQPVLKPGDDVGPYFNIWNSIFSYDSNFSTIMKKLDEIQKTLASIRQDKVRDL